MITIIEHLLSTDKKLNIYGAGKRAQMILDFLYEQGMNEFISCFIVSDTSVNPERINTIPVLSMHDDHVNKRNHATIIALADRMEARKVQADLLDAGYGDVWRIVNWNLSAYSLYKAAKEYFESLDRRVKVCRLITDEFEFCHILLSSDTVTIEDKICWRFYYTMLAPQVRVREEFFPKGRLLEEFEEYYGTYYALSSLAQSISDPVEGLKRDKQEPPCGDRFKIFRAACASDTAPLICTVPDYVTTVQSGAALTDVRICELTDDTGENISRLNKDFSECTVLYWMWKNVHDADYLGLFHFARFMEIPDGNLQSIADAGIDIVVTTPMIVGYPIKEFFCPRYIPSKDWRLMEEALLRHYPEYAETLERYENVFCYPGANLSIMRKAVFEEYAEFVFAVMMDIAEYYDSQGIVRNDRYAGYLCENLTAMFVMHHKNDYKIAYTDLLYVKDLS